MANINQVIQNGRLVKDPEIKTTSSGLAVAQIVIAVDDFVRKKKQSYFFDLKAFGKIAEIIRDHYKKGDVLAYTGKQTQERWEKDGKKNSRIINIIDSVDFAAKGKKSEGGQTNNKEAFESSEENEGGFDIF